MSAAPPTVDEVMRALAPFFSHNRTPHMSGDPTARLNSLQRRECEDAAQAAVDLYAGTIARVRAAALEEAARECDEYAAWRRELDDGLSGYSDQAVGATHCAAAIRAMANKECAK